MQKILGFLLIFLLSYAFSAHAMLPLPTRVTQRAMASVGNVAQRCVEGCKHVFHYLKPPEMVFNQNFQNFLRPDHARKLRKLVRRHPSRASHVNPYSDPSESLHLAIQHMLRNRPHSALQHMTYAESVWKDGVRQGIMLRYGDDIRGLFIYNWNQKRSCIVCTPEVTQQVEEFNELIRNLDGMQLKMPTAVP